MSFPVVFGIALALAMDAFAVSLGVACGLRGLDRKQVFRLAFHFGLFQFGMPILGWMAGKKALAFFSGVDHWVAFGLLSLIGGRMIYESVRRSGAGKDCRPDQTRGFPLFILAVATSIDALAVGLSLGVMGVGILYPAAVTGAVCFVLSVAGAKIGPALGRAVGRRAELVGGLLLLAIGVKILSDHFG